jgi:thiamine biosynthesis lipoprotein
MTRILASFWFLLGLTLACQPAARTPDRYLRIDGNTMGTYYQVTCGDAEGRDFQTAIDSLLEAINSEVSTYVETSTISRLNRAGLEFALDTPAPHFLENFRAAKVVYAATGGAFDPTVMPLVNYWGFGYTGEKLVSGADSARIDSLRRLVGFDRVRLDEGSPAVVRKAAPGMQLDFSAIAKGYAADAIGRLLEDRGVRDYLIDIGGELLAKGRNSRGEIWSIGINAPREDALLDEVQAVFQLDNRAVATSGNYRNYYEVEGVKYSHTINPFTGYPERNTLLSATVFAPNCMIADAYATACMVLGLEKAFELISRQPEMEVYLLHGEAGGAIKARYSPGLEKYLNAR